MFHANAWGQPYAAVMAGADLLMPDMYLRANPGSDISSLKTVCCGGSTGRAGHTAT
jgi:fatty-acyl-CoA synthase